MKKYRTLSILIFSFLTVLGASLMLGTETVHVSQLFHILSGKDDSAMAQVVLRLRLPRILLAFLTGSALSVSGAMFQALLRNPLADPFMVGISSGAAVGVTLSFIAGLPGWTVIPFAFVGSLLALMMVWRFSGGRGDSVTLVLSGLAVSFVLSSLVLLLVAFSGAHRIHKSLMWLMGDLSMARFDILAAGGGLLVILLLLSLLHTGRLDVLMMGETFASGRGVSRRQEWLLFWHGALLAAVSVSLAGVIGFVGIMVPHTVRRITGVMHGRFLPVLAVAGGIFLVAADTLGRTLLAPMEIPVGVITGFLGGLFFLSLVGKQGGFR